MQVVRGQDVMISVYNIHHSPAVWDQPEEFIPERFGPLDGPVPNEQVWNDFILIIRSLSDPFIPITGI